MANSRNRRRTRLVNRDYQLGIAWRMMIAYFLFLLGGLVLMLAPSIVTLATQKELAAVEPAARELLVLHERIWPAALFIGGAVFVYTLVVSHRIAGPIYRIDAVIRQMIAGEYPDKVALRRGDHFHETADLLTALSRKLAAERAKNPPAPTDRGPGSAR